MSSTSPTTVSSSSTGQDSSTQSTATPRYQTLFGTPTQPHLIPLPFPISSTFPAPTTPPGYNIQVNHHYYPTPPRYSSWLTTTPPHRASSAPPVQVIEDELPPLQVTPPQREPSPQPSINATCHRCDHRREVVYLCHRLNPPLLINAVKRCSFKFCEPCLKQLINKTQHVLLPNMDGWREYYQSRNDDDWCCPRCHLFCDCTRCMKVKLPQPVTDSPSKPRAKISRVHQLLFDDMDTAPTSKVRRHERR
jgi:hypothetical protein